MKRFQLVVHRQTKRQWYWYTTTDADVDLQGMNVGYTFEEAVTDAMNHIKMRYFIEE